MTLLTYSAVARVAVILAISGPPLVKHLWQPRKALSVNTTLVVISYFALIVAIAPDVVDMCIYHPSRSELFPTLCLTTLCSVMVVIVYRKKWSDS